MMKFILLLVILLFAVAVAMALVTRLFQTQQRLGELQSDLKRNNDEMQRHRRRLEEIAARQAAENEEK